MGSFRLTASGLARAERCPSSVILPGVEEYVDDEWTSRGSEIHKFLENVPKLGVEAALAKVAKDFRNICQEIDLNRIPASDPGHYAQEVAFGLDLKSGKAWEIGRGIDRYYPIYDSSVVCGTADVVGVTEDTVLIDDYKTGWASLGDAAESLQLGALALMACTTYGVQNARVRFIRIDEEGQPHFTTTTFDMLSMDAILYRIQHIFEAVSAAAKQAMEDGFHILKPVQGDHCRYCPAFARCPAKITLIRATLSDFPEIPTEAMTFEITKETAETVLDRVLLVEKVAAFMKSRIQEYALSHPIHLSDGRIYGGREDKKMVVEVPTARAVLKEMYGIEFLNVAVEVEESCSKASIERAAKDYVNRNKPTKPGLKIKHVKEAAIDVLKKANAVREVPVTVMTKFRPKQLAPGEDGEPVAESSDS